MASIKGQTDQDVYFAAAARCSLPYSTVTPVEAYCTLLLLIDDASYTAVID